MLSILFVSNYSRKINSVYLEVSFNLMDLKTILLTDKVKSLMLDKKKKTLKLLKLPGQIFAACRSRRPPHSRAFRGSSVGLRRRPPEFRFLSTPSWSNPKRCRRFWGRRYRQPEHRAEEARKWWVTINFISWSFITSLSLIITWNWMKTIWFKIKHKWKYWKGKILMTALLW